MKIIKVKNLTIGEGTPKIAVSITGDTKAEIIEQIQDIDMEKVDIIEWRVDFFQDPLNKEKIKDILQYFKENIADMPIIFTFRSKEEGGRKDITLEDYIDLNSYVAKSRLVDIIDVEVFLDEDKTQELIETIHKEEVFVIGSNHDFSKTPAKEDMINTLRKIENTNADILKLAVMSKTPEDVLSLLNTTNAMSRYTETPIVTMSMGDLGTISRISGETFGSSITFGTLEKASAPGQLEVDKLYEFINLKP